ncbi:hypothetical protein PPEP_a1276 [Pseudoalteromonas peptidolytica F12-50-A1]|uniref:Uncharacterized protein n=1 Tax=Pseudoalteromonas peptidolytica F12-50-A1 TaxID=1315280 RepID=A0A8I0T5H3_9GAMM|nr:hypothetical protein [Pseudoalteromonas peptidolytica F12-50-A1]
MFKNAYIGNKSAFFQANWYKIVKNLQPEFTRGQNNLYS